MMGALRSLVTVFFKAAPWRIELSSWLRSSPPPDLPIFAGPLAPKDGGGGGPGGGGGGGIFIFSPVLKNK